MTTETATTQVSGIPTTTTQHNRYAIFPQPSKSWRLASESERSQTTEEVGTASDLEAQKDFPVSFRSGGASFEVNNPRLILRLVLHLSGYTLIPEDVLRLLLRENALVTALKRLSETSRKHFLETVELYLELTWDYDTGCEYLVVHFVPLAERELFWKRYDDFLGDWFDFLNGRPTEERNALIEEIETDVDGPVQLG